MPADVTHPGRAALEALDGVLAQRPKKDDDGFTQVTLNLTAFRDDLIHRHRGEPGSRARLEHLNAVLSVALAGHFPLGDVPWGEIEKARGWLADLVADAEA